MGYVSVPREGILFLVEAHGFLLLKMGVKPHGYSMGESRTALATRTTVVSAPKQNVRKPLQLHVVYTSWQKTTTSPIPKFHD